MKLADASQRCPMLLRVGKAPVTPVPPQLVAEVLDTVGLCLGTNFALRGVERERGRRRGGGEGSCLCPSYIELLTATLCTTYGKSKNDKTEQKEQKEPRCAEITRV